MIIRFGKGNQHKSFQTNTLEKKEKENQLLKKVMIL